MAKKKERQVQQQEIHHRINFLHQAAFFVASLQEANATGLARYYGTSLKEISTRTLVRRDPSIKRAYCRRCNTPLIPNQTASVSIQRSHGRPYCVTTCHACSTARSFPIHDNTHILFNAQHAVSN
jgi:ribonuclease P protein subunit RPR2